MGGTMPGPVCKVCVVQDSEGLIENFMYLINKSPKTFYQKYFCPIENETLKNLLGSNFNETLNSNSKTKMLKHYLNQTDQLLMTEMQKYMKKTDQTQLWQKVQKLYDESDDNQRDVVKIIQEKNLECKKTFDTMRKQKEKEYTGYDEKLYNKKVTELTQEFQSLSHDHHIIIDLQQIPSTTNIKEIKMKTIKNTKYTLKISKTFDVSKLSTISDIRLTESRNLVMLNDLWVRGIKIRCEETKNENEPEYYVEIEVEGKNIFFKMTNEEFLNFKKELMK